MQPYYAEQESMPMGSSYGYVGGTSKYDSGPQGSSYPPMPVRFRVPLCLLLPPRLSSCD